MRKVLSLILVLLSGCMTINADKSVVVEPSDKTVVVTAHPVAHCQDWVLVEHCTLNVTLDKQ